MHISVPYLWKNMKIPSKMDIIISEIRFTAFFNEVNILKLIHFSVNLY